MRNVGTRQTWRRRSPRRSRRARVLLLRLTLVLTCLSVMFPTGDVRAVPPTSEPEPTTTTSTTTTLPASTTTFAIDACTVDVPDESLARCQYALSDRANSWTATALWVLIVVVTAHLILYVLRGR